MEGSNRYSAGVATSELAGQRLMLVGTLLRRARKFLTDFGGHADASETPSRKAASLFEAATAGLLGSGNSLSKKVTVANRTKIPTLGYIWEVKVEPALMQVLTEQFLSVSAFFQKACKYEQAFVKIEWVPFSEMLTGKRSKRCSPTLLAIVRHMSLTSPSLPQPQPQQPQLQPEPLPDDEDEDEEVLPESPA